MLLVEDLERQDSGMETEEMIIDCGSKKLKMLFCLCIRSQENRLPVQLS